MKRFSRASSVWPVLASAFLSQIAAAHHSRAEFAGEVVEVEGAIVRTIWTNPHPYLVVAVAGPDGRAREHRVELYGNLFSTERIGLQQSSFAANARLKIAGVPSTRRADVMLAYNVLLADGSEAVLTNLSSPRWTDKLVEGEDVNAQAEAVRARAAQENKGVFRVWTPRWTSRAADLPYTAAALAARAQWDELDNFLTRCEQPGMPLTMLTPQDSEFVREGDTLRIRAQFFDTTRTVHMGPAAGDPAKQPATRLGYSVGRWEGPTLVIETTRINCPYFDVAGTPQSEAVRVVERYTPTADQSGLHAVITVTDPATFSAPAVFEGTWVALGRSIQEYNCQVLGE
jgi:hypothetical protein